MLMLSNLLLTLIKAEPKKTKNIVAKLSTEDIVIPNIYSQLSTNKWIYILNLLLLRYFTDITCIEGDIRLTGGIVDAKGQVEICHNNEWRAICDDSWNDIDGMVACRQLGLPFKAVTTDRSYRHGTRQTWAGNLSCTGSETRLIDCIQNGFDSSNCSRGKGAGLVCIARKYWSVQYFVTYHMHNGTMAFFMQLVSVTITDRGWYKQWTRGPGTRGPTGTRFHNTLLPI